MPLKTILVPYVYDMDVHLVAGDGSEARELATARFLGKFENEWGAVVSRYEGYVSVHLDREQTRLVAVKALHEKRGRILDRTSHYELVSIDLRTATQERLLSARPGEAIRCPQWSPARGTLAFWRGAPRAPDAGIYVFELGADAPRLVLRAGPFYDSCNGSGPYLRWLDPERLVVYAGWNEGIWVVDTKIAKARKIDEGRKLSISPQIVPRDFGERISHLPRDVIIALWGDSRNPRAAPYWSPDARSYFYEVVTEGFWARRSLERYEPHEGKRSRVKTVWWSIYRE